MSLLDEIITVNITKQVGARTSTGIGVPLILGSSVPNLNPRVKAYTSAAEVFVDFPTANNVVKPEYTMALRLFGQAIKPSKILIGQKTDGDVDFVAAYNAIKNITEEFYAVLLANKEEENILAIAQIVETEDRLFAVSTDQDAVLTDAENDNLLRTLFDLNLYRTSCMYLINANAQLPEAGLFARLITVPAGSETMAYKTLSGVTPDNLTSTARSNIISRNGIFYSVFGGVPVMHNVKTVAGEYIDIIYGIDWLKQRIKDNCANLFLSNGKIPYTDSGIELVATQLEEALKEASRINFISDYNITVPRASAVLMQDKIDRVLKNVSFSATLTGAIEKIQTINGVVVY